MNDCPFCHLDLIDNQKVVLENENCMFIQVPQEILIGSGLIIPRAHRETVFELTEQEWTATKYLLKEAKDYIDKLYNPDGYNIGWNCNSIGGQHIMHAHLHIIPRYVDEPYAGKGIRHWLKSPENKRAQTKNID
ncbi:MULTISPECIES: HIT family protein [unclassified Psychrobacillus]|uniref:HIT family protein n=1 Tax=unclassified Psychrobacillus TaxID=2636677 RepID=UPI00146E2E15|nr:HIT family protein [Psychrobacillus sp. BL-248-WT-3]NME06937.1 HIT family protein [Psychrobacillus sp. BL-248-WT-3]